MMGKNEEVSGNCLTVDATSAGLDIAQGRSAILASLSIRRPSTLEAAMISSQVFAGSGRISKYRSCGPVQGAAGYLNHGTAICFFAAYGGSIESTAAAMYQNGSEFRVGGLFD